MPEDASDASLSETLKDKDLEDRVVTRLVEHFRGMGADRLALEISDERFARRISENQLFIREAQYYEEFEKSREERLEEIFINLHSRTFDHAATYNNFVITAGYAGFFAIWNFVSDAIDQRDTVLVGLLLGISLLSFIGWTLLNSVTNQKSMARISAAMFGEYASRAEKIEAIQKEELAVQSTALRLAQKWRYWFEVSVISGFSAGLILLSLLFAKVAQIPFSFAGLLDRLFQLFGF